MGQQEAAGGDVDQERRSPVRTPQPYANPYVAGAALGVVLLACFVLTGHGLGASGAFSAGAAGLVRAVAPATAATSPFFSRYLGGDGPWLDWLVLELVGVFAGAWLSAVIAGRWRAAIRRGPRMAPGARIAAAAAGGAAMGIGAVLARGCTSGQALSGGALLSVGSWIFLAAAFGGGYLAAPLLRRLWRPA